MSSLKKNKGIVKQKPLIELLNKKVDLKKKLIRLKKNQKEPIFKNIENNTPNGLLGINTDS